MKIDIRDMMDSICEETVEIQGRKIASDERIKELTMQRIAEYKGTQAQVKTAKPASVLLIAAIIVLALGATALAYTLGAGDFFKGFFTRQGGDLGEGQHETMNSIGMVFDSERESNGTVLRPLSAIADENVYYLLLEVNAPEGTTLPPFSEDEGYYQFDLSLDVGGGMPFGHEIWTQWMPDENPKDSVMQAVILIMGDASGDIRMNDATSKQLTLTNLYVQSPSKEYKKVLDGEWKFDISLLHEETIVPLDVEGKSVSGPEGSSIRLTRVEISPLSLLLAYTFENAPEGMLPGPDPIRVVLKDGKEVGLTGGPATSGDDSYEGYFVFDAPVNLDDVAYVELAGQQFALAR